jgi:hypothetical protein
VSLDISVKEELASKLPPNMLSPKLKSLDVAASAQISLKLLQAASGLEKLSIATKNMDEEVVACLMEMESVESFFKLRTLVIEERKKF